MLRNYSFSQTLPNTVTRILLSLPRFNTAFMSADLAFILEHANDDPNELLLHAHRYPGINLPWCVTQIEARKKIRYKLPQWHDLPELQYPTHLSLEQASSETTARHKAALMAHDFLQTCGHNACCTADLTGGLGVDSSFIAQQARIHHYFERQSSLCEAARHNFQVLGLDDRIVVHEQTLTHEDLTTALEAVDVVYLDPARRSQSGSRVFSIEDCEPDLLQWKNHLLQNKRTVWVKLSPMIDLTATLKALPQTQAVHIISVKGEVKELLLCLRERGSDAEHFWEDTPIYCTSLHPTDGTALFCFSFTIRMEQEAVDPRLNYPRDPEDLTGYLLDPDKSILKAGAFKYLAQAFPVEKVSTHTHLYHTTTVLEEFPGRTFRILQSWDFNKRSIAMLQKLLPGLRANVTTRHFPLSSEELQQKMKLKNGDHYHVFATTLEDRRKILLLTSLVK